MLGIASLTSSLKMLKVQAQEGLTNRRFVLTPLDIPSNIFFLTKALLLSLMSNVRGNETNLRFVKLLTPLTKPKVSNLHPRVTKTQFLSVLVTDKSKAFVSLGVRCPVRMSATQKRHWLNKPSVCYWFC